MKKSKVKNIKKEYPIVSLIIVNFNGKDIMQECLPSLFELDYPKNKYEVVVVDNGSSDGSVDFLRKRYPKVKIVDNKKNLGYVGVNNGIKHCKGEYIYFLNNDIALKKDCLKLMVEEIESNENAGMVGHNAVNYFDRKLVSGGTWISRMMYSGHYQKGPKDSSKTKAIPYLGGGMIRKSIIIEYGYLFDPDYFIYAEDLDLGLRIRLIGKELVLVTNALCYHMHSVTTMRTSLPSRNTFLMERNLLTTFFKIFSAKNIVIYAPIVLGARFLSIVKDLANLNVKNAWARMRAIAWIFLNIGFVMEKRRHVQSKRKADDKFLLKVFSEKYVWKKPFLI